MAKIEPTGRHLLDDLCLRMGRTQTLIGTTPPVSTSMRWAKSRPGRMSLERIREMVAAVVFARFANALGRSPVLSR